MRGHGDFFDDIGSVVKTVGGGLIDKGVGLVRGTVNGVLHGGGDYRIAPQKIPTFESHGRENSFIHKEYLGDIFSATTFTATTFNINPGLGDPASEIATTRGVFPWLARIAQQYEEYRLEGMVFYYIPTSSDAVVASATTPALGSVSIASEYNSNKEDFTNLTDMLNHQYSDSAKPSEMIAHPIECAGKERPTEVLYIRSDKVTADDILHYDICKTTVAVTGCQAAGQNLGQLWVSYKVVLLKPVLEEQAEDPFVLTTHYRISVAGLNNTAFFGSTINQQPEAGSTFECKLANTTITMPANITSGNFMLWYGIKGSSTASLVTPFIDCTTNCQNLSIVEAGTGTQYATATKTDVRLVYVRFFKVTGPSAVLTFGGGTTLPTSLTSGDLIITQINSNVITKQVSMKPGCFWRATKEWPNPPWAAKISAEQDKKARRKQARELRSAIVELLRGDIEDDSSDDEKGEARKAICCDSATGESSDTDYEKVERKNTLPEEHRKVMMRMKAAREDVQAGQDEEAAALAALERVRAKKAAAVRSSDPSTTK